MKSNKAFTIIELVGTFAVMVLVVSIATVSIGGTLNKNKVKTNKLKSANILRSVEDYIITNKLTVSNDGIPLYFSINALIKDGVLPEDANAVIEDTTKLTNGPYFIEAIKPSGDNIEYRIINKADIAGQTNINYGSLTSNTNVDFNDGVISVFPREEAKIKFKILTSTLALSNGVGHCNLYVEKATYTILKDGVAVKTATINNLIKDDKGEYSFKINNSLGIGTYQVQVDLTTDLGKITNTTSSILTMKVRDPLLFDMVVNPSAINTWQKQAVVLSLSGYQLKTNAKADYFTYEGVRYPTSTNANPVTIPKVEINAVNGMATVTFNTEGRYVLNVRSGRRSPAMESTDEVVQINIDLNKPTIGNIVLSGTLGLNGWYVSPLVTVDKTNGSDPLSGHATTTISTTSISADTGPTGMPVVLITCDNAGNCSQECPTIKKDSTPPVAGNINLSGTVGLNGWYKSNVAATAANGTDAHSGHASTVIDKSSITGNTLGTSIKLTTKDVAGNTATKSVTVKIDQTLPTLITTDLIESGVGTYDQNWTKNTVTWSNFVADDTYSEYDHMEYSTNCTKNNWSRLYGPYVYTNDNYTFCIRAVDKAGNQTAATSNYYIKVDQIAPVVTAFNLRQVVSGSCTGTIGDDTWTNDNVCILPVSYGTITATDENSQISKYLISTGGAYSDFPTAWNSADPDIYITTEGTKYRYIKAVDNAGNISAFVRRTIKIDKNAPTATFAKCDSASVSSYDRGVNIAVENGGAPVSTKVYYQYNNENLWSANFYAGSSATTSQSAGESFKCTTLSGGCTTANVRSTSYDDNYHYLNIVYSSYAGSSSARAAVNITDQAGNNSGTDYSPYYNYTNISTPNCWFRY